MQTNEKTTENVKILLVDDKDENLVAMKKTLAPLKIEIVTANSGNDALKLMLNNDFAVVLLDVMMPGMNGFEVAKLMHENDVTKHIPIIFVTAVNKSEQNYIEGMEAGAIDYLYKPIDPIILLSKVRVFMDLYSIRARLETTISKLNEFQQQLQEKNNILKQLSEEDMLTKAANRRHFEAEIQRLMEEYKNNDKHLGLFFIDVDDFKGINDTKGHRVGDLVLTILVAKIMQLKTHPDLSNAGLTVEIIARLGGDEFAVVVSNLAHDPQKVSIFAKLLLKTIEEEFNCDGNMIKVSLSIGVANYPEDGTTLNQLIHEADLALYQAKAAGKNTYFLK